MYAFFERLVDPFKPLPTTRAPHSTSGFCRYYARGYERYFILMGILTAAIALIEVSLFRFLGQLVDWLSIHDPETFLTEKGSQLITLGVVLVIALPTVFFLHSAIIHQTLLGNFPMSIRWSAHRYLLTQSVDFYQNEFAGRLATKVMQTSLAVRETITKLLDVMLYVAVYFTAVIFLALALDWRLALPFVFWIACYAFLLKHYLPRLSNIASKQADARSDMTGRIVDTYTNIATVKLFSHSRRESQYAREGMENFLSTVHPQMRMATSLNSLVWLSNCVLASAVAAVSIYLWHKSAITPGAIAAAIGLNLRLFGMSQWIMWEVSALFENIGTVRDGMNTLTLPTAVNDEEDAQAITINNNDGIRFENVHFHYGKQQKIIEGFNLHIKPGERIGLVGRSGAGKSTLVNLLLRFYDVENGRITIDNQNIAHVTQNSLRAEIGMVTQDTSLLHRSIKENITYGKPESTNEEVLTAIAQAHADDFVKDLIDAKGRTGLDAHAGERGVKLSGGQRQRIAIARVLLKNAPILVLDEATSALDSEVEQAIQENLSSLMEGKTVIAIAHRLSTIASLDRLIVIDKGRIVEEGPHETLVTTGGIYAQLWHHQSGGFLGES